MRIGTGFDVHRLVAGRRLVLGGVVIPSEFGALGHSDADVVCHALIDAILGALAEEDIGARFPDTDIAYKDISSLELLRSAGETMRAAGYRLGNADITVMLEKPKIGQFREAILAELALALSEEPGKLSVKATTTEGLGLTGRGEGIAAQAVVLLIERESD